MIAFLKAIGSIIPLMDEKHGDKYTNLVIKIIKNQMNSPEDELKKAILKILFEAFSAGEAAAFQASIKKARRFNAPIIGFDADMTEEYL